MVGIINTERMQNESELDYHKRLIYGKIVDKTLSDVDYSELAELVYGQAYSSDVARRMMYGSRRTLELLDSERTDAVRDDDMLLELESKRIEIQKERQKFFDQRNAYNKILRERSRQEELNEIIVDVVRSGNLPSLEYTPCVNSVSDNDLIVTLNDIHYGANVHNAWCTYNSDVCRYMMRKYIDKIISIAEVHHSENCIVVSAGDSISGNIHYSIAVSNKENVIEQIVGVSELISGFIAELSKHFNTVRFISVAGNHSRINPNKDQSLKDERLDDLIEWYLSARLQNFDNVIINNDHKMDSTISVFNIRGLTYCCVHGDFDGSVGKTQALQAMVHEDLYAVISGHKHHNAIDDVHGIKTVMAGSFLGMDDYCVQNRIYGRPEQMVCVCDEDGIRCHYDIDLRLYT